jgi:transglutaminase-like putative cysteine protease
MTSAKRTEAAGLPAPVASMAPVAPAAAGQVASQTQTAGASRLAAVPEQPGTRRLRVLHETRYAYDAPVELAHHLAHLRPRATPWQFVEQCALEVQPAPDGEAMFHSIDPWGNWRSVFTHTRVHDHLLVRAESVIRLEPVPALKPAASPQWEAVAHSLRYRAGAVFDEAVEFTLPSVHAPIDAALAAYARAALTPERPLLEGALALMHHVHREFRYRPSSTSVATGALEVLALRYGVCQDFAHLMIGCLRSLGLAARYVSGYLLTHPPAGQPRLVGADASHAWVAVWCPVHGWIALDPTNDVDVRQEHVTLAWGRDYADVAPLRGVIRGRGQTVPEVAVTVAPEPAPGSVMG